MPPANSGSQMPPANSGSQMPPANSGSQIPSVTSSQMPSGTSGSQMSSVTNEIQIPSVISVPIPSVQGETQYASCADEVNKVKKEMEQQMSQLKMDMINKLNQNDQNKLSHRYFESLLEELHTKNLLDESDINNIRVKMQTRLLSLEDVVNSLEIVKKQGQPKPPKTNVNSSQYAPTKVDGKEVIYNELPKEYYMPMGDKIANEWDTTFSLLNTDKWRVPMPKPPVCINTTPCQVCNSDNNSYSTALKYWDDSRNVTGINK
jgi:hypothetical protein